MNDNKKIENETQSQSLILKKIPAITRKISAVGKTKENRAQGWKFRGVDEVYNAVHPLLGEEEVTVFVCRVNATREEVTLNGGKTAHRVILEADVVFMATDGSSIVHKCFGEAIDTGDKAFGKAETYLHKNAFIRVFSIPTDEKDPDSDVYEVDTINPKEIKKDPHLLLRKKILKSAEDIGWKSEQILNYINEKYQVKSSSDLSIEQLKEIISMLDTMRLGK